MEKRSMYVYAIYVEILWVVIFWEFSLFIIEWIQWDLYFCCHKYM